MMQRFSQLIISGADRILNAYLSAEEIKKFVIQNFNLLNIQYAEFSHLKDKNSLNEFLRIREILISLKWISSTDSKLPGAVQQEKPTNEIISWKNSLTDHVVFQGNKIQSGSGRYLDEIDEIKPPGMNDFLNENLEKLLRHVEVKRNKSLREFTPIQPNEQEWIERQDITLLFVHHAHRTRDLRFLNAACKLNDWDFPFFQKQRSPTLLLHYLLCLAEQEWVMGGC